MCSSTNVARKHESTTWAASVPLDDLAHAIKAAVGVQPVRQLTSPVLLKSNEQQTPQQQCSSVPANALASSPPKQASAQVLHTQAPLPVRRPTPAEIQAASPVDSAASCLCMTDSGTSSPSSSVSDVDSACMQLLLSQKQQWSQLAEPASPVYFDDMDDMQQQLQDRFLTLDSSSSSSSSSHWQDSTHDNDKHLGISRSSQAVWGPGGTVQLEQQKELLCKIWSELQLPVQHEEQDYLQQQEQQLSPDSVLLSNTVSRTRNTCRSSCCSVEASVAVQDPTCHQSCSSSSQGTSIEVNCCCSSMNLAVSRPYEEILDDVSCSRRQRKQRRVSWGPVTEYRLPDAAPSSITDWLPSWVQDKLSVLGRSKLDARMVIGTAGLVACLAGTAGIIYARREHA